MIFVTKTFLPPQEEYQAILKEAWDAGWITNRGALVQRLEQRLKSSLHVTNVIATTNGTLPLQIAIKALGLAFEVDAPTRVKYKTFGIDLENSSGQDHHLLPVPAALLVNNQGLVTFSFISPNYKVRADNELIMAAARAQK